MVIRLECDNCERSFEVDPAKSGGKVPCPHCGDVNRVPAQVVAPGADIGELPPGDGPEREIRVLHPAMMRAHRLSPRARFCDWTACS